MDKVKKCVTSATDTACVCVRGVNTEAHVLNSNRALSLCIHKAHVYECRQELEARQMPAVVIPVSGLGSKFSSSAQLTRLPVHLIMNMSYLIMRPSDI